jgi:hypothetical protein
MAQVSDGCVSLRTIAICFRLRTLALKCSHRSVLIRLRHLQLRALAFDAAGFCTSSFDPPSLSSFLSTLAALFRIVTMDFLETYAVAFALVILRSLRLRALTFNISGIILLEVQSCSLLPYSFALPRSRLPWVSTFVGLRSVAIRTQKCFLSPQLLEDIFASLRSDSPSTFSPSFPIFGASTSMDSLRKRCRRMRIDSAFDLFGWVRSPSRSLPGSVRFDSYRCVFDLRRHIVSFRLPCLRLHSTSTFLHNLVARSCALREGE